MRFDCSNVRTRAAAIAVLLAAGPAIAGPPVAGHDDAGLLQQLQDAGITASIVSLDVDPTPGVPLVTEVVIDDVIYSLDLRPHSLRSADYRLLVQQPDGSLVEHDPGPERTLRGEIVGMPGSSVVASLLEDGLHAMIDVHGLGAGDRHFLEPVSALVAGGAPDQHALYHETGIECPEDRGCGVAAHQHDARAAPRGIPAVAPPATPAEQGEGGVAGAADCMYIAEIAADADWEYFDGPGQNSVSQTQGRITSVFNSVSNQYENEVDIEFVLTGIVVRASPADPYTDTNDGGLLLAQFTGQWNSTNPFPRDLAQLFTGRNFQVGGDFSVIGLANLSVVCTNSAYSIVEDEFFFGCRTDLTAHEVGHNWSAQHCSCGGFTMNAGLTCGNQFTTASENSIIAHRNTRPCLDVICPPDNNSCADAIEIGTGVTPFTTLLSTEDGPDESGCGAEASLGSDVWFTYTSPCEGDITFSLCDADYDTRLAIYGSTSCPAGPNTAIACSDDFCGEQSEITLAALENEQFLIRVAGNLFQQGSGNLVITTSMDCFSIPGNDTCSSATTVQAGTTFFSTLGASSDSPDEPAVCDFGGNTQIDNDVWFRHVTQCNGELTVSLCGSGFDTKLAIYGQTCPGGPGQALACSDDSCGDDAELTIPVSAGQLYRIRVGGFDGANGFGQMTISCAEPACAGDTNGDGEVNVDDLTNVITDWGTNGVGNGGDIAGAVPGSGPDGVVNVDDLNAVIVSWGLCR